jgi:hypothetical protein
MVIEIAPRDRRALSVAAGRSSSRWPSSSRRRFISGCDRLGTMAVDIQGNLKAFLAERAPCARYASFDYCFNHFQQACEDNDTARLADADHLLLSCLQLGFYLASWGMMRGSGDLLQRSVRELAPVVEQVASEPKSTWALDAHSFTADAGEVLALSERIQKAFSIRASDILLTKVMLGVFGCVPAFDRFFQIGFKCNTLCERALLRIGKFYDDNQAVIDASAVWTLDFDTGLDTERRYSRSKLIDMVHFQEGFNLERQSRRLRRMPDAWD